MHYRYHNHWYRTALIEWSLLAISTSNDDGICPSGQFFIHHVLCQLSTKRWMAIQHNRLATDLCIKAWTTSYRIQPHHMKFSNQPGQSLFFHTPSSRSENFIFMILNILPARSPRKPLYRCWSWRDSFQCNSNTVLFGWQAQIAGTKLLS